MNARPLLLLALVAAVAGGVVVISSKPTPPPPPDAVPTDTGTGAATPDATPGTGDGPAAPPRAPFVRAAECRACHEDVYAEWEQSYHGMAWTDPMVQALSNGFRMTECIDCHAPQPIHLTGVDKRVAPRQHNRGDGVDCISCHLLSDGISVAAASTVDTSAVPGACRPVASGEMTTSTPCAGCHNQHETVDELLASGLDATCQTCHMEEVDRKVGEGATRKGRSHLFPAAHSEEMHRRAVELTLRVDGGKVLADVRNAGAGHKVPTDARHRSYNLWVSAWDQRGNPLVAEQPMTDGEFRLYYRDDFRESTQITYGETRTASWEVPQGFRGKVVVTLTYALNPEELAARRVFDVHTQEIQIP